MGFFSRLANKVSSIASKVVQSVSKAAASLKSAATKAVSWARDKLENITYDAGSTVSRVDVEKVLADFRNTIEEEAKNAEDRSIEEAMAHFDTFAEDLEVSFPEFADLVRIRQEEVRRKLNGIIIPYVQIHISENDPEFQKVLEMQPGSEKQTKLDRRMTNIIEEAEAVFRRKLKEEIKKLNKELDARLEEKIRAEEELLGSIAKKYEDLEKQISEDSLDLKKLEEECRPAIQAADCIQRLLEQETEGI